MNPGDLVMIGRSAPKEVRGKLGILLEIRYSGPISENSKGWEWCVVLVNDSIEDRIFLCDLKKVSDGGVNC